MAFVWLGAAAFAASLASFAMVYGYLLRVPAPATGLAVWPALLINVSLFTVFALHHSIMARTGAKAWIGRIVSPGLERSTYVWIASLLFIAVCWLWQPVPGSAWIITGPLAWPMYTLQVAGLVLTGRASAIIGVWELAGVKQANQQRPVAFTASGPFALVRHPIYLGWVLIVFGAPAMPNSRLLFAVISTAYLVVAIPWEEASLVATFGEKYQTYQRQVRSRLLPGLW